MKTYTKQHRDGLSPIDHIRQLRKDGKLAEAQQAIHAEVRKAGGKVSSLLADQMALLHMAAYNFAEARDLFLVIASKFPDQALVWRNAGQCSEILGDYLVAKECYRKSVEAFGSRADKTDEARAYFGYGAQLFRLGDPTGGEHWWREGLTKDASSVDAKYQRAQVLLTFGDYENGWREYEVRKQLRGYDDGIAARLRRIPDLPEWDGKSEGRVFCVMSQGAGDVVQMARYLPLLDEASGYEPRFYAGGPLRSFLRAVEEYDCDYIAHLDSMPLLLRRPEPIPPHCPNPWRRPKNPKPRIGVCWKGSSKHLNDKDRSCPFDFRPNLASEQWELVSVQEGHDFAPKDYLETAELMRTLDAVVTVDTSTVHVAGTLGVPTICLVPSCPEWRWGIKEGVSPWYPSVRTLRRRDVYDWVVTLERAKVLVEEMVNA